MATEPVRNAYNGSRADYERDRWLDRRQEAAEARKAAERAEEQRKENEE
jgi:hypothetical protein